MQLLFHVALASNVPKNSVKDLTLGLDGIVGGVGSCLTDVVPAVVTGITESTTLVSTLVAALLDALESVLSLPLSTITGLLEQILSIVTGLKA